MVSEFGFCQGRVCGDDDDDDDDGVTFINRNIKST